MIDLGFHNQILTLEVVNTRAAYTLVMQGAQAWEAIVLRIDLVNSECSSLSTKKVELLTLG